MTSVYPEDEDRGHMADVDFLVRAADWDRAGIILEALGFRRETIPGRSATDHEFYEAGYTMELPLDGLILFEPHRQLIQPARRNFGISARG